MVFAVGMGLILLLAVFFLLRWYVDAKPTEVLKALKIIGIGAVIAVGVFFLVTGKVVYALMALPALLPWILRFRRAATTAKNFSRAWPGTSGGPTGQASQVTSRFLDMTLDHDSGNLDGYVVDGDHAGTRLADLSTIELLALLHVYRQQDTESAQLLEAYLDRDREGWRDTDGGAGQGSDHQQSSANGSGTMTHDEAYAILGLAPGADDATIREAYRRLISNAHPDHGGSDYLAAKINQAKDVLLGR